MTIPYKSNGAKYLFFRPYKYKWEWIALLPSSKYATTGTSRKGKSVNSNSRWSYANTPLIPLLHHELTARQPNSTMFQPSKKHLFYACSACEDDKGRHTKDITSLHGCGVVFFMAISAIVKCTHFKSYTWINMKWCFAMMNWVMPVLLLIIWCYIITLNFLSMLHYKAL